MYGDQQELEEAKEILTSQKQKFTMNYVHILDKEKFEERFNEIREEGNK